MLTNVERWKAVADWMKRYQDFCEVVSFVFAQMGEIWRGLDARGCFLEIDLGAFKRRLNL